MPAPEQSHGFVIDAQACRGRLACMRSCPTHAIRVREGKAQLLPDLCIDCGSCLRACPSGAIHATTRSLAELDRYRCKVALPSPVLFGQFPLAVTPAHVVAGLRGVGFDVVADFTVEMALVNCAVRDYVSRWSGPHPLLSVWCPVVVRLVQVLYPRMVGQLIPIHAPRELAGRAVKEKYARELGVDRDEIAAIYITPCQAKTVSIWAPAEGGRSHLDGALGISDVYNDILSGARPSDKSGHGPPPLLEFTCRAETLRWATHEAQERILSRCRYMSVTGLANVIQVFDDIEKGKLRNIEYLECYACWGGCANGNLTVDNVYITLSKIHQCLARLAESDPALEADVERRYPQEDFSLAAPIRPRTIEHQQCDLKERVERIKREETLLESLPGLNCGLCGAPTCETFARDVGRGIGRADQCVLFSAERLRDLRATYLRRRTPLSADPPPSA
jgi:Na+-translocating ferredoxin:NAD+ oxidoreductase RNF subunit RnfB